MKLRLFLVLTLGVLAASCQTMTKEECAVADWRVVGEQDGAAGYSPQDRFARHVKACTRAGIAPDQTLWYQGYQQGLPRYCTPLNGLSVGSQGKSYANVCPIDMEAGFRQGYDLGRRQYDKASEIRHAENRIRSLEQSIRDDQKIIAEKSGDSAAAGRRIDDSYRTIRDLDRQIGRLQSELRQIEYDVEDFRYRMAPPG